MSAEATPRPLTVATWNVHSGVGRDRRYAPGRIAEVVLETGADVIALQEVDGPDAAKLVFPNHEFCFSSRVHVQNIGFAVRRGQPFECGAEVRGLSMNDDVRRGVELRLFPGTPGELRLLSVHLKSGCSRDPLDSTTRASCGQLAAQVSSARVCASSRAASSTRSLSDARDHNAVTARHWKKACSTMVIMPTL